MTESPWLLVAGGRNIILQLFEMYTYKATVLKIVDGDTIDVNIDLGFGIVFSNQRIRLYGIDAPETRTKDKIEKQRGLVTKLRLQQLCPVGSSISVRTHLRKRGKYGRILGELYIDGNKKSVNSILVKEGLAKTAEY